MFQQFKWFHRFVLTQWKLSIFLWWTGFEHRVKRSRDKNWNFEQREMVRCSQISPTYNRYNIREESSFNRFNTLISQPVKYSKYSSYWAAYISWSMLQIPFCGSMYVGIGLVKGILNIIFLCIILQFTLVKFKTSINILKHARKRVFCCLQVSFY